MFVIVIVKLFVFLDVKDMSNLSRSSRKKKRLFVVVGVWSAHTL